MQSVRFTCVLLVFACFQVGILADDLKPTPTATHGKLDGQWLFESAMLGQTDQLDRVWSSVVSISSDRFEISNFVDPSKQLKGNFSFDERVLNSLDLTLEELDFASLGEPYKISASTLNGIVLVDDENTITIALNRAASAKRPTKFESSESVFLIYLRRAPRDFKEYPKEITVRVTAADGKPVEGAIAATFHLRQKKPGHDAASWEFFGKKSTDSRGMVLFPYDQLPKVIRDETTKQVAFPQLSPSLLANGDLSVILAPECYLQGTINCEELSKAGQPLGWTNVYLEENGRSIASCSSENGKFDFLVPPGKYQLNAYGSELHRRKVTVTVPANRSNFTADPIALKASEFAFLKGKPAPEFVEITGWSGEPVTLSDMKGKYVLVDFWGYWCGPCVGAMPVLIELHEKFSDKGLAIVGVHVDGEGEVDTDLKLKEKLKHTVKETWNGKEMPFSNALVSGKIVGEGENRHQTGTPKIYGVLRYPTTILIDPEGKIVGEFNARDINAATAKVEILLESLK